MNKNLIKCAICALGIIINIDKCLSMNIDERMLEKVIIPGCIEGETSTILHKTIEKSNEYIQEAISYPNHGAVLQKM